MLREGLEASTSLAHAPLSELAASIALRSHIAADAQLAATYAMAIEELKKSFGVAQMTRSGGGRCGPYGIMDAFTWVFIVAEELLPLLRTSSHEAIAVFAYFSVLLQRLESHWWMQGWARELMAQAYEMLDDENRLLIAWAADEMGFVPESVLDRV